MTATFDAIIEAFTRNRDRTKAEPMQRYMKTNQPFFGIQKPQRAKLIQEVLKRHPVEDLDGYRATVLDLWNHSHREAQYAAMDIAMRSKRWVTDDNWDLYRDLVFSAQWWDTLDAIASNLVGPCLLQNRHHQQKLDEWAEHDGLWVRRAALLAHLKHKDQTDVDALERTILTEVVDDQFFIQKAIGWVLREYSKMDAEWVRRFIQRHRKQLSKLAIREGSKYV